MQISSNLNNLINLRIKVDNLKENTRLVVDQIKNNNTVKGLSNNDSVTFSDEAIKLNKKVEDNNYMQVRVFFVPTDGSGNEPP